jgi:hypothetical protein
MASGATQRYPRKVEIERVVSAIRASGVDVGEVEVGPDGTIRVTEARSCPREPQSEFDRWDQEGRL